jgi:hypothetical protein
VTQGRFALGSAAISLPTVCHMFPTRVSRTLISTITGKGLPSIRYAGRLIRRPRGLEIGRRQLLPLSSNFSTRLKINIRAYMHEDNTLLILLSAHPSPSAARVRPTFEKAQPSALPHLPCGLASQARQFSPESDISVTREICRGPRPPLSCLSNAQVRHHLCAQARIITM